MKIDKNLISKLEALSMISLSADEQKELIEDLEKMIEMIDKLQSFETEGVDPLIHLNTNNADLRSDEVRDMLDKQAVFKNSANVSADYFIVPKVINRDNH